MSELLNPRDFMITRKRKKYRFAKFSNASNCFEFGEWTRRKADVIEVGAGTGLFCVELAAVYPNKYFVAIDVKADRLQKGAYEAIERGITNIAFVRCRADQITELFPRHSITQIWLTFPDPFPKKRSTGRRLTHRSFLAKYQLLLQKNGALYLKHDSRDFFDWSLEQLVAEKWHIEELSFDLHTSELSNDYKIFTTYEERWIRDGANIHFVKAVPHDNKT